MELRAKTELLKHFQKVYNEEINESVKISNEEIEYFVDEYLLKDDVCLKKITDRLLHEITQLPNSKVNASIIKSDEHFTFKRELIGDINGDYFFVVFRRELNEEYFIKFGYGTDCKEQIKELIKSIEPRAIVN